jgi:hypothetical protein
MASYNNPLQCEGWKTPVVLQFAKKTNFKKLKIVEKKPWETREEIFLKQHKKIQIKKEEEDKLLINK